MQDNVTSLRSLLADLEKATGAGRDYDAQIDAALGITVDIAPISGPWSYYPGEDGAGYRPTFEYTSSLDAAIALVERVLPGSGIDLCVIPDAKGRSKAYYICQSEADWTYEGWPSAYGPTPPLALLTALFRALVAKLEKADG